MGIFYGAGLDIQSLSGKKKENNDDESLKLGIVGAVGTYHHFRKAPIELGAMISPIFYMVPSTEFALGVQLYGHFYF